MKTYTTAPTVDQNGAIYSGSYYLGQIRHLGWGNTTTPFVLTLPDGEVVTGIPFHDYDEVAEYAARRHANR